MHKNCPQWLVTRNASHKKGIHKLANHSSGTFIHSRPKAVADGCGSHWPATVSLSLPHLVFVASYINICIIFAPNEPKSQLLLLISIASVHYVSKLFPCFFPMCFSIFFMIPEVSHVLWELSSIWPWLHSFDSRLRSHLQAPHGQGLAGYLHNSPGISWLVVSNMAFMFHNILGIIIPSNWLFFFQRGWNHQPVTIWLSYSYMRCHPSHWGTHIFQDS